MSKSPPKIYSKHRECLWNYKEQRTRGSEQKSKGITNKLSDEHRDKN